MIVAGGDSFVWGSELADSPNGAPDSYSRNTFTALLAGSEKYICAAYPGNSNHDISQRLKRTLERLPGKPFVIVCWTWPSRDTEYASHRTIVDFQQYCEYHGFPYLFTCADNCLFDVVDSTKLHMENWYMFPAGVESWETQSPRGFYQWARENKYMCGVENHPLEQAHIDASKLMQEKFNAMVKKSVQ
jgi:hypothetical protein